MKHHFFSTGVKKNKLADTTISWLRSDLSTPSRPTLFSCTVYNIWVHFLFSLVIAFWSFPQRKVRQSEARGFLWWQRYSFCGVFAYGQSHFWQRDEKWLLPVGHKAKVSPKCSKALSRDFNEHAHKSLIVHRCHHLQQQQLAARNTVEFEWRRATLHMLSHSMLGKCTDLLSTHAVFS